MTESAELRSEIPLDVRGKLVRKLAAHLSLVGGGFAWVIASGWVLSGSLPSHGGLLTGFELFWELFWELAGLGVDDRTEDTAEVCVSGSR